MKVCIEGLEIWMSFGLWRIDLGIVREEGEMSEARKGRPLGDLAAL